MLVCALTKVCMWSSHSKVFLKSSMWHKLGMFWAKSNVFHRTSIKSCKYEIKERILRNAKQIRSTYMNRIHLGCSSHLLIFSRLWSSFASCVRCRFDVAYQHVTTSWMHFLCRALLRVPKANSAQIPIKIHCALSVFGIVLYIDS